MNEATISESETDDDVGRGDTSDLDVDQGKYKGRQRESTEAKGSRVGELAVGSRPVKTWLEFTSKGRQTGRVTRVRVQEGIATIVVCVDLIASGRVGAAADGSSLLVDHLVCVYRHNVASSLKRISKNKLGLRRR